jgi:hypothetical protein
VHHRAPRCTDKIISMEIPRGDNVLSELGWIVQEEVRFILHQLKFTCS